MEIKDIIAKIVAGQELAQEEKDAIAAFDPDKAKNDAAAAARKDAEAKTKAAQAELQKLKDEADKARKANEDAAKAKMTEAEQLKAEIAKLSAGFKNLQDAKEASDKALAAAARKSAIASIREEHKLRFIDGVDQSLVNGAFADAFAGLDDLSDKAQVAERVQTFMDRNKALIVDNSIGGTGNDYQPKPQTTTLALSDADRVKQLVAAGI